MIGIKLLNELIMKNGRNLRLYKKYFSAALIMIGMHLVLGNNLASAEPCESEIKSYCSLNNSRDRIWCSDSSNLTYGEMNQRIKQNINGAYIRGLQDIEKNISSLIENRNGAPTSDAKSNMYICFASVAKCMFQKGSENLESNDFSDYKGCDGGSQTSSSGSSSQSNKKANRQTANNQSNQSSSNKPQPDPMGEMGDVLGGVAGNQTSSNSNDLSKMSGNQLIDVAIDAESRGDYARAYLAELQLSKDPNPKLSRQGLRQVSFRLRTGKGVAINRTESHRLAIQAASLGDVTAHSYVCADYLNGKGVEENHRKALDYCLFAAEKGDMKAQNNLAWLYRHGSGIQQDQKLSEIWTCKAAAQGEEAAVGNIKKLNINCN